MSYTIKEEKQYRQTITDVFAAAVGAVSGLNGKVAKEDAAAGLVEAQFDKTIHGKVLGDRTRFFVRCQQASPEQTTVSVEAFPIDAVGRPLMFGARKGVARTVLDWYWAHLEHRLKK